MAGFTNRGKYTFLSHLFRAVALPTNYYVALCTDATAPTPEINTFTELTEIADTQGYTTGGYSLTPGTTDFDVITELDSTDDYALVQIKDMVWTASGGTLPASGDGARYAVLLDDNATIASRVVYAYWDLTSARQVSDGQTLTLQNCELRLTET